MKILTYAAIDIGSNAVRLLINHIYENENNKQAVFNKTSLIRVPIRLGHDVFTMNKISDLNLERLIKTMKSFKLMMEVYQVEKYRAFATSAMRDSENGKNVIDKIKSESDILVELISGEQEAEIIFQTELFKFNNKQNYLFVDVGGGSTEISLIHSGNVIDSKSFQIGTVRMLEGKVPYNFLINELKPYIKSISKKKKITLIGSGGNINFAFKFSKKEEGKPLSYFYLKSLYSLIKGMSFEDRLEVLNMKPDRADVIIPALQIYINIMKWSDANKIFIPKVGVSDGMIKYMYYKN